MVLKPAPLMHDRACGVDPPFHTQDMASGSDGSYGPIWHGFPVTTDGLYGPGWHGFPVTATVNADTSTQRIDLAQATEIWQYEQDCSFLARHQENDRRRAWQYRQNLKLRRWEAWERVTMSACDTNVWANVPHEPVTATPTRSLRQHILEVARQWGSNVQEHQVQALAESLPQTPDHLKRKDRDLSPAPDAQVVHPPIKKTKQNTHSWIPLEDFVINQYLEAPSPTDPAAAGPAEPVIRKNALARWACYSRVTPKLNKARTHSQVAPPYGIQLIQSYRDSLK